MTSKYEPLEIFLQESRQEKVDLSFRQVEQIIGGRLPKSAYTHRAWWSNQKDLSNRPQARAWRSAGFIVADVRQTATDGAISFQRARG